MESIISENRSYWTGRAAGYSEVNRRELETDQRVSWFREIGRRIGRQFPGTLRQEIRVLEVGTGPGFFAIILAEAGYNVTAIDLTPAMLEEARHNAGALADRIDFREMNAEALEFQDGSFDVVISRNLTWNLPHPGDAYREWRRVLKDDGLLLNFDANWYMYLFDEHAREGYEDDRRNTAEGGYSDGNIGENFDVMEDIARRVPLSSVLRPAWDVVVLSDLGMDVRTDELVWQSVWSEEEKVNYASTPQFLVEAVKRGRI
ncbi:MAG: class I SAM-dependent methyltransferase [Lachnospiraceae bacterium]|nr:class I SAM-dependent methyltransferase [Lachnospiraceae bacterium]